jgi:hypothetical protein
VAHIHRCQDSDHISKLADQFGFLDWRTIWDANPDVQRRRASPNLLFKGDRVSQGDRLRIPDRADRDEGAGVDAEHLFELLGDPVFLRIRILKDDFTAIASAPFELRVDGVPDPFSGSTDAMGQLEVEIPRDAQRGTLTVRAPAAASDVSGTPGGDSPPPPGGSVRGDVPTTWNLRIGALNSIMENAPDRWCISGVQQRLNNLATNTGPVDGILGPNTRAAVRAFQTIFALEVDGRPGQLETQPKLVEVHDRPDSVVGPATGPPA